MRTLCQVTSRKKRVFSSNLQTFITAAWQLISVRKYLRFRLTQKCWQHGTRLLMSGKSVECNCGQLDPHGIGIQCSRDLVERQENPGRRLRRIAQFFKRGSFQILSCEVIELLKNNMYAGDLGPSTIALA